MSKEKVQGSSALSVYCSSTEDFDNTCDICLIDGDHVCAVGLCVTCGENMCKPCFKSHSKSKASKHHDLRDRSGTPQVATNMLPSQGMIGADTNDEEYELDRELDCKTDHDNKKCHIICIALFGGSKVAVADDKNSSVKVLDTETNNVTSSLVFENVPAGLTAISGDTLAVVVGKRIKIISTSDGTLTVIRTFKVLSNCWDITVLNGKLFVLFRGPLKFQILGLSGGIQKTIKPESNVDSKVKNPSFIAVHPDEKSIYVTDWTENMILRVGTSGALLAVYEDEGLRMPCGIICTPSGSVYVCNNEENILYKMPADLSEAHIVLAEEDGLDNPLSICYEDEKNKFYISSSRSDVGVKMYKRR